MQNDIDSLSVDQYGAILNFPENSNEKKLVDLLLGIGIKRNVATTLTFLLKNKEVTSRGIERGANLRQPEVSSAMRELKLRNWVSEREVKKVGRGRPLKYYKMRASMDDIVKYLTGVHDKETERLMRNIQKLKKLSRDISGNK